MKDFQGNEIMVGDAVHVKVGTEWIVGNVLKIQEGGLSIPLGQNGQPAQTPDALVLQVAAIFQEQPGMNHGSVMKLAGAPKPVLVQ